MASVSLSGGGDPGLPDGWQGLGCCSRSSHLKMKGSHGLLVGYLGRAGGSDQALLLVNLLARAGRRSLLMSSSLWEKQEGCV